MLQEISHYISLFLAAQTTSNRTLADLGILSSNQLWDLMSGLSYFWFDTSLSCLKCGLAHLGSCLLLRDKVACLWNKKREWNTLSEQKKNGILLPKLFWPTVRKNCSSDREIFSKFEAEGREFAKFLRSLEQFIQTVKGQNNFW